MKDLSEYVFFFNYPVSNVTSQLSFCFCSVIIRLITYRAAAHYCKLCNNDQLGIINDRLAGHYPAAQLLTTAI